MMTWRSKTYYVSGANVKRAAHVCWYCRGTGYDPYDVVRCPECGGSGLLSGVPDDEGESGEEADPRE